MNKNQARQGDVFLRKIESGVPSGAKKVPLENGRVVLAHGEVTGHMHAIEDAGVELFEKDGTLYLRNSNSRPSSLNHQEHGTVLVDPGVYEVTRQSEWSDADEPRQVAD